MVAIVVGVGVPKGEGPVKADDGDVEVEAKSNAGIHGDLVVEGVEVEFATRKQLVGMVVPDVAGIGKQGTVEGTVDGKSEFGIAFQLYVANTFDVLVSGSELIGART